MHYNWFTIHTFICISNRVHLNGLKLISNDLQSCLVYPHTLIPNISGWISEMCGLAKHLIICGIKMCGWRNNWIIKDQSNET